MTLGRENFDFSRIFALNGNFVSYSFHNYETSTHPIGKRSTDSDSGGFNHTHYLPQISFIRIFGTLESKMLVFRVF